MTSHPEKILRTLDGFLDHKVSLILYGRAALALGYEDSHPAFHSTMDVDAILPVAQMSSIEADESFWSAIEKTNEALADSELYLTHLFADDQVILRGNWLEHVCPIPISGLTHLRAHRPDTLDLILTKMMRVDPQDREDIRFLLNHCDLNAHSLEKLLSLAKVPDISGIQEAFDQNSQWLRDELAG